MAGVEKISDRYKLKKEIGRGAYGAVWSAKDLEKDTEVAIKRIGSRNFEQQILTKRALRELKLLRHLNGHENVFAILLKNEINVVHQIIQFVDANVNSTDAEFTEMFIVEHLMEADLNQIIKSRQNLTVQHYQYFIYQILRGLKWMHSANILHRDLKPGNLLVNADCELRICDFGLARGVDEKYSHLVNTEYVATRYYRAPEVVLSPKHYKKPIDIWSVGCIFAELVLGKVLFKGSDYVDQLRKIFDILGTPEDPSLTKLCSPKVLTFIKSWPRRVKMDFKRLFPGLDANAIDLIDKLLAFDPLSRITANDALSHPFLSVYHFADDEPNHPSLFDFSFESISSIPDIKKLIVHEVSSLKESRKTDATQVPKKRTSISSGNELGKHITQVPKEEEELVPNGYPTCIEEELSMNDLKI